jgi:two-component system, NtrC family, response regulator HydG
MSTRVLIVDDDAGVRFLLREVLEGAGLAVTEAADGSAALEALAGGGFDLVLTDLRMPRLDGQALLTQLRAWARPPKVIVLTAHGSERHAVDAIKAGAFDYFRKPFDNDELLAVVQRALRVVRLEAENEQLSGELNLSRSLLFASPAMKSLAAMVSRIGPRDVTVLITGESGTGKERVAEAIVSASRRAGAPFLRFNCASISGELAEAELFGHARGAFTGAVRARPGLFREADGGTLLLDEIGELDAAVQAKLLRVLQEQEVRPVGEERAVKIDVRILAATHRDLARDVADGRFREDLYYRIRVVSLEVPPLRARREDVSLLARHFVARFVERFRTGPLALDGAALARLEAHGWPGNVRELEHVIESAVALSHEGRLEVQLPSVAEGVPPGAGLKERVDAYERGLILAELSGANGNRSEAARRLQIARATLHEKLRKYGIGDPEGES